MEAPMNSSISCIGYIKAYFLFEYEPTSWVTRSCYVTATISTISAVPATFLNLLVIAAIARSSTLRSPSFLLICSMAVSDLLVGLLFQPRFTVLRVAEAMGDFDVYCHAAYLASFGNVVIMMSVMTVAMISIDRYLALHLKNRYKVVVTKGRVVKTLLLLWTLSICLGAVMPLISITVSNVLLVTLIWPVLPSPPISSAATPYGASTVVTEPRVDR
ncbi:histamine H2 receptor-like [Nematostella vectensis]|uniref:histamine H2 receptor-like n=1 Tax=Nematostella vectensis TaxID=45351 RepID=UPI002076F2E1|nr:histamine H2 receptor-like [Nematostella vectensis]